MDKGLLKIEELREELLKLQQDVEEIEKEQNEINEEQDSLASLENKKVIIDKCKDTKKIKLKIIKESILGSPFVVGLILMFSLRFMNLIPTIQSVNALNSILVLIISVLGVLSANELCKLPNTIADYNKRKKYLRYNDEENISEKIELYKQRQIERKFSSQELQEQKDNKQNRINVIESQIQQIEQIRSNVIANYLKNNPELDNILNTTNYEIDEQNKNNKCLKKIK